MSGMLFLKDFGAVGDGVTDDTSAVQAAINAAQGGPGLFADAGTYRITASIAVTSALTLQGVGNTQTVFKLDSTTQDGFVIATTGKITMSGFSINGKPGATAGNLLSLASGSSVAPNQFASFRDVRFSSGYRQFTTLSASGWMLDNCLFFSPTNRCVTIANTVMTDAGDQAIIGCTFSGQPGIGAAIVQESAGGLRLIGNKIIQFASGYTLSLASGVATSVLFVAGNSFEAFSGAAITLNRGAGVVFGAVHITGNELSGGYVGVQILSDTGPWMSHVQITGNFISTTDGGTGIVVLGTTDFTITGNTLVGVTGGTGINIGAVTGLGNIADNNISGYALPVNNAHTGGSVRLVNNIGHNPVGASSLTPSASPWTFQNGPCPSTLYLSATGGISGVTINGGSILPGTQTNFSLQLGPNDAAVITYGGTLTSKKMTH